MENLIEALKEMGLEIEENGTEVYASVSIECKDIHLENLLDLTLVALEETEDKLELLLDSNMIFSMGKNYDSVDYDEYENAYTIIYRNNVIITITIM